MRLVFFSAILTYMILSIFTDGGSKGNPGPAAIGIVCYDSSMKELFRYRKDSGIGTNNEAEYTAVITALKLVKERLQKDPRNPTHNTAHNNSQMSESHPQAFPEPIERINFNCDSQLVVRQLNGEYRVKKGHIQEFVLKIRSLESELGIPVMYTYIPRERNKLADA